MVTADPLTLSLLCGCDGCIITGVIKHVNTKVMIFAKICLRHPGAQQEPHMTEATGEKKPAQGGLGADDGLTAGVDSFIHYGGAVIPKNFSPVRDEVDVLSVVHYGEAVFPKAL